MQLLSNPTFSKIASAVLKSLDCSEFGSSLYAQQLEFLQTKQPKTSKGGLHCKAVVDCSPEKENICNGSDYQGDYVLEIAIFGFRQIMLHIRSLLESNMRFVASIGADYARSLCKKLDHLVKSSQTSAALYNEGTAGELFVVE
eukprot:scaffold7160_cov156-Ochromonas_danica.AAC.11